MLLVKVGLFLVLVHFLAEYLLHYLTLLGVDLSHELPMKPGRLLHAVLILEKPQFD